MIIKFYEVTYVIHAPSCSTYKNASFFRKEDAFRFAKEVHGIVKMVTGRLENINRNSIPFHELPESEFY